MAKHVGGAFPADISRLPSGLSPSAGFFDILGMQKSYGLERRQKGRNDQAKGAARRGANQTKRYCKLMGAARLLVRPGQGAASARTAGSGV
jgi:hypothetical protein